MKVLSINLAASNILATEAGCFVGIVAIALWVMKLTVSGYGLIVCGAAIAGFWISPKNWWAYIATFTRHAEVPGFRSAGRGDADSSSSPRTSVIVHDGSCGGGGYYDAGSLGTPGGCECRPVRYGGCRNSERIL